MTGNLREKIESAFRKKIIDEQHYSWGETYWLQLGPVARKTQRTVSIVNLYPYTEQKVHPHPGYEEVLFGLAGESIHWSNGRKLMLPKGTVVYIPAGEHRMLNPSGQLAQMMSIVYPQLPIGLGELSTIDDIELKEISALVNLEAISTKFVQSVGLAVTMVDNGGELLALPKNFPDFCSICTRLKVGDCGLESPVHLAGKHTSLSVFRCRFGVYSIRSPIMINDRVLGYLGCGYGRGTTPSASEEADLEGAFDPGELGPARAAYRKLDFINRNHLQSVAETLSMISASLVQLIVQTVRDKQINAYKLRLIEEKRRQAELESALNEAKLKLLESQVNPHFLFNTLNTIAQMSLMEGADTAARLTYALSNMLRRGLSQNDNLITLVDEINYVNDYILIQKTRFPDRFTVEIDIDPKLMPVKIPFMTLMILVENSIQHGFRDIRWEGHLSVKGRIDDKMAIIEVADNGIGIPNEVVSSLKLPGDGAGMAMHERIGLRNVQRRLEHYYGAEGALIIGQNGGQGTRVVVTVPVEIP